MISINDLFPFYNFKAFVTVLKGNRMQSFLEIFFLSKSFSKAFHSLENFTFVLLKKLFTKSLSSLIFFNGLFIDNLDNKLADAWQ